MRMQVFQRRPDAPRRMNLQWRARRRVAELMRICRHQYPNGLPHNALGAKYARYVCRSLAFDPIDKREQWLNRYAPWLDGEKRAKILSLGPYWYSSKALGENLELYDADREALKIRTIEAFDVTKEQREAINREKDRQRQTKKRRDDGARPREQYLAESSITRSQPWLAVGMSRTDWYRKGKPLPSQQGNVVSFERQSPIGAATMPAAAFNDPVPDTPNVVPFRHREAA